jgi:peptidoglycan pentaglycine glycine transferase (the first glycine)
MNLITNVPKERFNEFVKNHKKSHFAQSYEWGAFKANSAEWDFDAVGLVDESGNLVATALVLIRYLPMIKRPFLYIPRGFVIDFDDKELLKTFVVAFKKYAKSKKAIFFKIDPDIKYVDRDVDGRIIDQTTQNDALIMDLKNMGFKHLGFTQDFDSTIQPRYTFRLEMSADAQDLLKRCHSKTRYNIKVAQKKGIEIIEATRDELPIFEHIMRVTGQRDGFLTRPLSYFENMYDQLNSSGMCKLYLAKLNTKQALDNTTKALANTDKMIKQYEEELLADALTEKRKKKITNQLEQEKNKRYKLTANLTEIREIYHQHPEGIIMSGIITIHFGDKSWYLYGASDNLYREFMPNYLIQWHALTEAKKAGYKIYDFFGISGRIDEADPLHGLYRFKKGFSGEFTEFIGEFDYVVNPILYFAWTTVLPMFKRYRNKRLKRTKG